MSSGDQGTVENLSHAQSELGLGDRLLQQVDALVETVLMNYCISRIARHVEHFERGTELLRPSAQLAPVDASVCTENLIRVDDVTESPILAK